MGVRRNNGDSAPSPSTATPPWWLPLPLGVAGAPVCLRRKEASDEESVTRKRVTVGRARKRDARDGKADGRKPETDG
ncbi:hypothetical protein ZHAS_00015954 [Anopheles sinensis]|uniref:Uncharacterized protein n=1 Tax=Anopheles sinensis TaxID=74873 RepID=A0A084WCF3_ANOSI|nr:hypothetical protein ZHAS_00015954 [Anopheles sinensis]